MTTTQRPSPHGPELITKELPGPRARAIVERDRRAISASYTRAYPLAMSHGRGALLWDVDGNRFLDFTAGIAVGASGHSHPRVVKAIRDQAGRFLHMSGTDFYYDLEVRLGERITKLVPGSGPKQAFFSNSGTEAVEAAMKLARYQTRRPLFMAFYGAFHGRTMGSLTLTASKAVQRRGFAPQTPQATHVPFADCKRCIFNLKFPDCGYACVSFIEDYVFAKHTPPEDVAALFVEPIQGEGGYVTPPPGYLERLRALCDKYGILFVADEVQSGMGRTGKWFAIEHWNVKPDVVTIAKGIASGMPLGITVASKELMSWPPGSHGNTFGGNPVSCAAALATLDLIEEQLLDNARQVGDFMKKELEAMVKRHPHLGWVNGMGLMLAVEVVEPDTTRGDHDRRDAIIQACFERGLLTLGAGNSAIRISPPLTLTRAQAQVGLEVLEDAVTAVESRAGRGRARQNGRRPKRAAGAVRRVG
ncbi:MAG TPA: acetyl ornithine aminotransferase family protein [Candidatus Eisenbacteria bacterium]|nr:acetyl ornithine aminotransferase family protein [Candidatus Eisenbacteria bacterium]